MDNGFIFFFLIYLWLFYYIVSDENYGKKKSFSLIWTTETQTWLKSLLFSCGFNGKMWSIFRLSKSSKCKYLKWCLPAAVKNRYGFDESFGANLLTDSGIVSCSGSSCTSQPHSHVHTDTARPHACFIHADRLPAAAPLPLQSPRRRKPNMEARAGGTHTSGLTQVHTWAAWPLPHTRGGERTIQSGT